MIYFGQEVGEAGNENGGFGTLELQFFDYVGVPSHQRWMNNGKFEGNLQVVKRLLEIFIKAA
jgi:hypothetical protein